MPYRRTLAEEFPAAVPVGTYLDRVHAALDPLDFAPERTFAAVSVCRDELTEHFTEQVADRWNRPFTLGGLGALPSLGHTGWQACLSHVPHQGGRGHLLVFGMPHVGIDPEGRLGQSLRRHQDRPTPTCGAMVATLRAISEGVPGTPTGLDDHEAERLRRLLIRGPAAPPTDLVELTQRAVEAVEREMWTELEALEAYREMDVAVFCGIQIHLPDRPDHIWPHAASCQGRDGVRRDLGSDLHALT
jgi:hypothetical protein